MMKHLRYAGYSDKLEDIAYISYGDLQEDKQGDLLEVPYTMHSDYSGSTVERANCTAFLKLYKGLPGVWEVRGGYGTNGVVILKSLYDQDKEIRETIDKLLDYIVIDDDELSSLEWELECEDWDNYIESDLKRELSKRQISYPQDDEKFFDWYRSVCDKHGIYWEVESAIGGCIDIEKIAECWEKDAE